MRLFLIAGAISGFLAVLLGAFGAHLLRQMISPDMLEIFKIGVQYQFYHAFALMAAGILMNYKPTRLLEWSGYLFITGSTIFSGFLYLLAITGVKTLGMIVPVGGLTLVAGWICMLVHVLKMRSRQD